MVDIRKSLQPNCIISGRIGNVLGEYMTTVDNFIPRLPFEGVWKGPKKIIRLLVKINSRGGNYLLNIGPKCTGEILAESLEILDEAGKYVTENAESIFETKRIGIPPYELE